GGKNRRRGKNDEDLNKRELIFKEDGQEYAQVVKMLGNGRLEAKCQDGETRLGQIRGQMRKKIWIVGGDIILLSLREFQDGIADVIHKYTADEARNLKTYGELKADFQVNDADAGEGSSDEEGGIEFEEAEIDDICELQAVQTLEERKLTVVQNAIRSRDCPGTFALHMYNVICRAYTILQHEFRLCGSANLVL
ncbi:uncharacterized protein MKK02DRAFT_20713, partial [Dioszegia hungarica]